MERFWTNIVRKFTVAFIEGDRWKLYLKGLGITIEVALMAAVIGIFIGIVVAFMKISVKRNGKPTLLSHIANLYINIIRGTPSVLQVMIMYFAILANSRNQIMIAGLSFGINSGAYVAEIIRAGILAVDKGQTEAGRSLGLNNFQTMRYIVIPQALKNVLPPLVNEFIVLLKETAVVGYVGLSDLTRVAMQIGSRVFDSFTPLIIAAVIYFVIVMALTKLLACLERRMRRSDNR